jgi:hypothetical protein
MCRSPERTSTASGFVGGAPSDSPRRFAGHRLQRVMRQLAVVAAMVALLIAATAGAVFARTGRHTGTSSTPTVASEPSGASQGGARKPTSLPDLLVQPRDTTSALSVHLLPGGDQVNGQPTLDLCNQTFASESSRVQRLQDVAIDSSGAAVLSTEAVRYRSAAATRQAFSELRRARASCPNAPVTNKTDGTETTTTFHAAPDSGWPQVHSVQRQAFSLTTVDSSGASTDSIAVYLRRGRVLLGVYFPAVKGEQPVIDGSTTPSDIVTGFATRIEKLPASFVADPPV